MEIQDYSCHSHFLSAYFTPTTILCNETSVKTNNNTFLSTGGLLISCLSNTLVKVTLSD